MGDDGQRCEASTCQEGTVTGGPGRANPPSIADVRRVSRALEVQAVELELLILRTPTGEARNALTEANIHIMIARSKLEGR